MQTFVLTNRSGAYTATPVPDHRSGRRSHELWPQGNKCSGLCCAMLHRILRLFLGGLGQLFCEQQRPGTAMLAGGRPTSLKIQRRPTPRLRSTAPRTALRPVGIPYSQRLLNRPIWRDAYGQRNNRGGCRHQFHRFSAVPQRRQKATLITRGDNYQQERSAAARGCRRPAIFSFTR